MHVYCNILVNLTFWYIFLQFNAKQQRQVGDQIIGFVDNMNTERLSFLFSIWT